MVWRADAPGGVGGLVLLQAYLGDDPDTGARIYGVFRPVYDARGNVVALVDSSGAVAEYYQYDAFGRTKIFAPDGTQLAKSAVGNTFLFSTKSYDFDFALYHFGARWYDPETGRFISSDPLGFADGPNPYLYVAGDPVQFIDPWGLCAESNGDGAQWGPAPFGQYQYMYARTWYGALGTAVYNVGPLVGNTVEVLLARPVRGVYRYADDRGWVEEFNAASDQLAFVGLANAADIGPAIEAAAASAKYFRARLAATRGAAWLRNAAASNRFLRWLRFGRAGKVAPRSAAGLTDDVVQLVERNLTGSGDTVLGSYPGYINKANARGASYFDIGNAWEGLTPAQRTAANNHFLDVISARGDRVLLSIPKSKIRAGTALADEVVYLTKQKGYVWVNQWSLRPGGG